MSEKLRLPDFSRRQTRRTLLVAALVLVVLAMLYLARQALLPFIIGLVAAYVLLPAVNYLDAHMPRLARQRQVARPLSIILVYLVLIGLLAGFVAFLVPVVAEQWTILWAQREELVSQGRSATDDLLGSYRRYVPTMWRQNIETGLTGLAGSILDALRRGLFATFGAVSNTISLILGFVVIPFWLFYLLNDQARVQRSAVQILPDRYRDEILAVYRLVDRILSAYLRGQLLLCLFVGAMATLGLTIVGVDFALLLGLIAAIFEILPYVGPILGAIPAVLVALLESPTTALWTVLVFFIVQQIENVLLVPRVAGNSVKLHPAMIMLVLVIGNQVAGLWGMLLAVPATAILRDLFKYAYLRLGDAPATPAEALERLQSTPMRLDV
jgi:predicted PurR-regulated permease PerM